MKGTATVYNNCVETPHLEGHLKTTEHMSLFMHLMIATIMNILNSRMRMKRMKMRMMMIIEEHRTTIIIKKK